MMCIKISEPLSPIKDFFYFSFHAYGKIERTATY